VPAEVVADQTLGKVVPIAFGRVDEVESEFGRPIKDCVRLGLGKVAAPLAAKLPGAQADDRHPQTRAAENFIVHGENLPQNPLLDTPITMPRRLIAECTLAAAPAETHENIAWRTLIATGTPLAASPRRPAT